MLQLLVPAFELKSDKCHCKAHEMWHPWRMEKGMYHVHDVANRVAL